MSIVLANRPMLRAAGEAISCLQWMMLKNYRAIEKSV